MCGYFWCSFFGFCPVSGVKVLCDFLKKKKEKERIQRINLLLPFSPPTPPGSGKGEVGVSAWNVGGGARLTPPLPLL